MRRFVDGRVRRCCGDRLEVKVVRVYELNCVEVMRMSVSSAQKAVCLEDLAVEDNASPSRKVDLSSRNKLSKP